MNRQCSLSRAQINPAVMNRFCRIHFQENGYFLIQEIGRGEPCVSCTSVVLVLTCGVLFAGADENEKRY